MMNKETAEKLAKILSEISCIPTFNGALLFSDDIAELLGFQIHCNLNSEGRTVFSIRADVENNISYEKSLNNFMDNYQKIHGNPVRKLGKHDINTPNYPTMGSDYVEDISPATIIRIMRVACENDSSGMVGILPAYIMRLTREVEKWSKYFSSLSSKTNSLNQQLHEVLEESF